MTYAFIYESTVWAVGPDITQTRKALREECYRVAKAFDEEPSDFYAGVANAGHFVKISVGLVSPPIQHEQHEQVRQETLDALNLLPRNP